MLEARSQLEQRGTRFDQCGLPFSLYAVTARSCLRDSRLRIPSARERHGKASYEGLVARCFEASNTCANRDVGACLRFRQFNLSLALTNLSDK